MNRRIQALAVKHRLRLSPQGSALVGIGDWRFVQFDGELALTGSAENARDVFVALVENGLMRKAIHRAGDHLTVAVAERNTPRVVQVVRECSQVRAA